MYLKLLYPFTFLICVFSSVCIVTSSKSIMKRNVAILDNVLNFCESNGIFFITLTSYSKHVDKQVLRQKATLFSLAQKRKMYTRFLSFYQALSQINFQEIDKTIILTNYKSILSEDGNTNEYLKLISQTKIRSSILVISTTEDTSSQDKQFKLDSIFPALSKLQVNMFFYVVHDYIMENGNIGFVWNQIITLQNDRQVIVNELVFDSEQRIIER